MNRQTVTIFVVLLAAVFIVLATVVYLNRGGMDDGPEPITGPGRASEARGIIADIQERRADDGEPAAPPQPALINPPDGSDSAPAGRTSAAPPTARAADADDDLEAAYERARELQAAGVLDDAQVLLFFGARQGHAPSAFAYAEMNDPNHHSPETSLLAEPDAFQAFRWYTAALDGGVEEAAGRLDALREWAETAAEAGDAEAERLLLQWE